MLLASALLVLAQAASPAPAAAPAAAPAKPVALGPYVLMETTMGKIKLRLYADRSPVSVKNFLDYVHSGHYDGTIFHRVKPGFMAQCGGMEPDMTERPTRPPIKNESKNGVRNLRGTVAMARLPDPNSATAQFFINVRDNSFLDYGISADGAGYAVFGEVVEGMDVVDKIVSVPTTTKGPHGDVPVTPIVITKVRDAPAPAPAPQGSATPKP